MTQLQRISFVDNKVTLQLSDGSERYFYTPETRKRVDNFWVLENVFNLYYQDKQLKIQYLGGKRPNDIIDFIEEADNELKATFGFSEYMLIQFFEDLSYTISLDSTTPSKRKYKVVKMLTKLSKIWWAFER